MAFIPGTRVALAEVRGELDSQRVENTLYFRITENWTGSLLQELADGVRDWYVANILPNICAAFELREVVATDLTSNTGPTATSVPATATFGSNTGEPAPSNVAVTVSFRTAGRGRSSRGRNYVMAIPNTVIAVNTITSDYAQALVDGYTALLESSIAIGTGEAIWGVFSRFHNNAPRTEGVFSPITRVVVVDLTVDSQRRRLPGRGN
jgi:hypothetical protein